MKSARIHIVLDALLVDPEPTGVGRSILELVQALAGSDRGWEFTVLATHEDAFDFLEGVEHWTVTSCPGARGGALRKAVFTQVGLPGLCRSLQAELLHSLQFIAPLRATCRRVVTVHDLGYLYFPRAHPWHQRLYLDLSTRWNARAAAHLLADSQATKADLVARYSTPPEKITVAYPGRDERLAPVRDPALVEAVKTRYGITGDYFLYLGTLQPRKNLLRLVAAFAHLITQSPHLQISKLILAGKRGWLYDDLFAQVHRLGLEGRVLFPGYVPDEDKAALLSGALAFVFPSLYEGFGLPVLEAQACGCPVITSITSSLPEVAGDAALLVDPGDTSAIAAAMQQVATDPTLRENLIERGFANVRRFSWTACAQSVLGVIEQCAEDASHGG